jgi:hypothetical protein
MKGRKEWEGSQLGDVDDARIDTRTHADKQTSSTRK